MSCYRNGRMHGRNETIMQSERINLYGRVFGLKHRQNNTTLNPNRNLNFWIRQHKTPQAKKYQNPIHICVGTERLACRRHKVFSIDIYEFLLAINYRLSIYKRWFRIIKTQLRIHCCPLYGETETTTKNPFLYNGFIRVRMLWHWTSQKNTTQTKAKKYHAYRPLVFGNARLFLCCYNVLLFCCKYKKGKKLVHRKRIQSRKILFNSCAENSFNEICYLVSRLGGIIRHQKTFRFNLLPLENNSNNKNSRLSNSHRHRLKCGMQFFVCGRFVSLYNLFERMTLVCVCVRPFHLIVSMASFTMNIHIHTRSSSHITQTHQIFQWLFAQYGKSPSNSCHSARV